MSNVVDRSTFSVELGPFTYRFIKEEMKDSVFVEQRHTVTSNMILPDSSPEWAVAVSTIESFLAACADGEIDITSDQFRSVFLNFLWRMEDNKLLDMSEAMQAFRKKFFEELCRGIHLSYLLADDNQDIVFYGLEPNENPD